MKGIFLSSNIGLNHFYNRLNKKTNCLADTQFFDVLFTTLAHLQSCFQRYAEKKFLEKRSRIKSLQKKKFLRNVRAKKVPPKKRSLLKEFPEKLPKEVEEFALFLSIDPTPRPHTYQKTHPTHQCSLHDPTYTKLCEMCILGPFFKGLVSGDFLFVGFSSRELFSGDYFSRDLFPETVYSVREVPNIYLFKKVTSSPITHAHFDHLLLRTAASCDCHRLPLD